MTNVLTESFDITKETRQGCPLSPLLFIMVLEVLENYMRETSEVKGVKIGAKKIKLNLRVLTLEEPQMSVKKAMEEIEKF